MKIGIDARKITDYGIGTHIRNVVIPAAIQSTQHEFFFYHDPADEIAEVYRAHPSFRWIQEPASKYSIREHVSLAQKAKEQGIDLFHSPHYTLPLALRCPSIVTIHDLIHFKFSQYFPAWKVKAAQFVMKKASQKAQTILTVSETTRTDLLEWLPEVESKTKVIYNRLTEDWFQPAIEIDPGSLGIAKEFLLYVGNFKKHKGIESLIEAYRRGNGLPQLVLVGQGHHADHDLTESILNTHGVRLLGWAEPEMLRALYSRALIFVFPSLYEGFGYPPLEAMAAGCPVLSSDAPAMKEVLGDAAEFFQRGNSEDLLQKLEGLLQDSARRLTLMRSGAVQARKFATEESIAKLAKEWSELNL